MNAQQHWFCSLCLLCKAEGMFSRCWLFSSSHYYSLSFFPTEHHIKSHTFAPQQHSVTFTNTGTLNPRYGIHNTHNGAFCIGSKTMPLSLFYSVAKYRLIQSAVRALILTQKKKTRHLLPKPVRRTSFFIQLPNFTLSRKKKCSFPQFSSWNSAFCTKFVDQSTWI